MPSNPAKLALAIVAASLVMAGTLFYMASAMTVPLQYTANAAAAFAPNSATTSRPLSEMHIADNGLALLRGAAVDSIADGVIHCTLSFDGVAFGWTIDTDANTQFITDTGEKGALADIRNGSSISVTGALKGGGDQPTIEAQYVRE